MVGRVQLFGSLRATVKAPAPPTQNLAEFCHVFGDLLNLKHTPTCAFFVDRI